MSEFQSLNYPIHSLDGDRWNLRISQSEENVRPLSGYAVCAKIASGINAICSALSCNAEVCALATSPRQLTSKRE